MKKKVLLMGKSGSGKTSMRSIIFANYLAKDTSCLGATIDVERSNVRFLGNLVINLWDCGGQEEFKENYFRSQCDKIFKNVKMLIYVFDAGSCAEELKKELRYYQDCLSLIFEYSPSADIVCLIHKMDLLREDQKNKIFSVRENIIINMSKPARCVCLISSIWDETLFKAWSTIVFKLIPNTQEIDERLKNFGDLMECDEVILFERATFLVISSYERVAHKDVTRLEKVSNIMKKLKFSCSKSVSQFTTIELRNSKFALFMDLLTINTFIMVVMSDPRTPKVAVALNIKNAQKYFEILENSEHEEST